MTSLHLSLGDVIRQKRVSKQNKKHSESTNLCFFVIFKSTFRRFYVKEKSDQGSITDVSSDHTSTM